MDAEQQRLLKLAEECAEVIRELSDVQHVVCKILKYGYVWKPEAHYPDKKKALYDALERLRFELLDLDKARLDVEDDLRKVEIV